jgi:hypothetical protein
VDPSLDLDLGSLAFFFFFFLTTKLKSIPLEPSSALALLPEHSSMPLLVSDAGLESLEAGVLGVISGPADVGSGSVPSLGLVPASPFSARISPSVMGYSDDHTPLRRWSDTQARLGADLLSDSRRASNPAIFKAFALPWEVAFSVSPGSSDGEASVFGVADTVELTVSEETSANAVRGSSQTKSARNPSPTKSLIRRGFFGPRAASPPTVRVRKAKRMRELKNLDCYMSPMKGQRRRGDVGSKPSPRGRDTHFSFPPIFFPNPFSPSHRHMVLPHRHRRGSSPFSL